MNRKKPRKALNESLAKQFVYGEEEVPREPVEQPTESASSPQPESQSSSKLPVATTKETDLMSKLEIPEKEATIRFTVDLPQSLHRKLSMLAAKTGRTKADIVRLLLDDALRDIED